MLNYFNFVKIKNDVNLITNDFGRFLYLSDSELFMLVHSQSKLPEDLRKLLKEGGFITDAESPLFPNEDNIALYRDSKNYIFSPTSLHIFVVTNECNLNCIYCQANAGEKLHVAMNEEVAKAAVDFALSSPNKSLSFEFQGGEPLLNFPIIRFIVEYAEKNKKNKEIQYSVVSNLWFLDDEMLNFFCKYNCSVSTSLDGPEYLHNLNRSNIIGLGSYRKTIEGINKLRQFDISVGAIETTTRNSLQYAHEIIDEYIERGFNTVFIRPLSPLGCAKKEWDSIGYKPEEFLTFYKEALDYIIELNKKGEFIQENYASILLSKILHGFPCNYMELRSPCGACTGQIAYYVNGDVFSCDEGRMLFEMGDPSFKIGNVFQNSYSECMKSTTCKATCIASTTECVPGCCDCAFQPYCGICPVTNKALYNDLLPKEANDYKCKINKGILGYLFEKTYDSDSSTIEILRRWIA